MAAACEHHFAGGNNFTALAIPWFVLATTGSPARMGVVVDAGMVPAALVGGWTLAMLTKGRDSFR